VIWLHTSGFSSFDKIKIVKDGEKVFEKFNASKEDAILRYKKLISEIKKAWSENPLIEKLELGLVVLTHQ
jgi:hypothetical protein